MTTPIRDAVRPRPEPPRADWRGLFQEPAYEGGQPYAVDDDEDNDED